MKRKIALFTGLLMALPAIVYAAVIKWSNPDMAAQRLFLTYWWQYILIFVGVIGGAVMAARTGLEPVHRHLRGAVLSKGISTITTLEPHIEPHLLTSKHLLFATALEGP